MIRAITKRDLSQIEAIHNKFYKDEFPFSDLNRYICNFAVVDDESDKIITAGVIRSIAEIVIVTDKDVDIHQRRLALLQMLTAGMQTTRMAGYDQLHAFIQDQRWLRHLVKCGFRPTVGQSLVINT
jgi:hypothetical protein